MKISGSCAIVTGGADGIGKSLVEYLVAEGANVVFGDISVEKGLALERILNKNKVNVAFCKCDVRKESELACLFEKADNLFDGAQIVVNNAGVASTEDLCHTTGAVDAIIDVNLKAVIKGTSLGIQHFMKQKRNPSNIKNDFCVINISSVSAILPVPKSSVYSTTKKGVMYFSQTMRYLRKDNIRINCIMPGFVKTMLIKDYDKSPELQKVVENFGGFVNLSDITKGISLLITDKNLAGESYIVSPNRKELFPRLSKSNL